MTEMPNEPNQYGLEEEFGRLEGTLEAAEEEVAELRAENTRLRAVVDDNEAIIAAAGTAIRDYQRITKRLRAVVEELESQRHRLADEPDEQLRSELARLRVSARWVVGLYESRLATDDDLLNQLQAPMRALGAQLDVSGEVTDG